MLVGSDGKIRLKWRGWTCHWVQERTGYMGVRSYDSYGCTTQRLVSHEKNVLFLAEVKELMLG